MDCSSSVNTSDLHVLIYFIAVNIPLMKAEKTGLLTASNNRNFSGFEIPCVIFYIPAFRTIANPEDFSILPDRPVGDQ